MTTWAAPFTVLMLGLWALAFVYVWRKQRPFYALVLILGSFFAFLSEYSAIRLGKYYYGEFTLKVCFGTPSKASPTLLGALHLPQIQDCLAPNWCIPLAVLALEGLVLFSILRTADLLVSDRWSKPFLDALLAINLDAILDPVASATRWCGPGPDRTADGLGLWEWFTGPQDMGYWFGIPVANYTAWFGSVLAFTMSARVVAHFLGKTRRHLLWEAFGALAALAVLFVLSAGVILALDRILNVRYDFAWQMGVMIAIVVISLAVVLWGMRSWKRNQPLDPLPVLVQGSLYVFCLAAILFTDTLDAKRGLIWVALVTTALGMFIILAPFRKGRSATPDVEKAAA